MRGDDGDATGAAPLLEVMSPHPQNRSAQNFCSLLRNGKWTPNGLVSGYGSTQADVPKCEIDFLLS